MLSDSVRAGLLCLAVALLSSTPARGKETVTAIVARLTGAPGAPPSRLSATIERYTSDQEAAALLQVLRKSGQEGLVDAVKGTSRGVVTLTGDPGWPINIARELPTAAGRRVVLVGVRPVTSGTSRSAASLEYPFRIIELQLGGDGRGDGRLVGAARLRLDERGVVDIDRYLTAAVQPLAEVRLQK